MNKLKEWKECLVKEVLTINTLKTASRLTLTALILVAIPLLCDWLTKLGLKYAHVTIPLVRHFFGNKAAHNFVIIGKAITDYIEFSISHFATETAAKTANDWLLVIALVVISTMTIISMIGFLSSKGKNHND